MKLIYTTLNNATEARKIGNLLLQKKMCNCVNFFPITCIYNYEEKITEEPEVVLIIKTKEGMFENICSVIKGEIGYENFIGELDVKNINSGFMDWLTKVVG